MLQAYVAAVGVGGLDGVDVLAEDVVARRAGEELGAVDLPVSFVLSCGCEVTGSDTGVDERGFASYFIRGVSMFRVSSSISILLKLSSVPQ